MPTPVERVPEYPTVRVLQVAPDLVARQTERPDAKMPRAKPLYAQLILFVATRSGTDFVQVLQPTMLMPAVRARGYPIAEAIMVLAVRLVETALLVATMPLARQKSVLSMASAALIYGMVCAPPWLMTMLWPVGLALMFPIARLKPGDQLPPATAQMPSMFVQI